MRRSRQAIAVCGVMCAGVTAQPQRNMPAPGVVRRNAFSRREDIQEPKTSSGTGLNEPPEIVQQPTRPTPAILQANVGKAGKGAAQAPNI